MTGYTRVGLCNNAARRRGGKPPATDVSIAVVRASIDPFIDRDGRCCATRRSLDWRIRLAKVLLVNGASPEVRREDSALKTHSFSDISAGADYLGSKSRIGRGSKCLELLCHSGERRSCLVMDGWLLGCPDHRHDRQDHQHGDYEPRQVCPRHEPSKLRGRFSILFHGRLTGL